MGGSSKKQTAGYKYYLGMHMILCHGPVDRLLRIRVDEKNAWLGDQKGSGAINVSAESLFGGESREGGVSGTVDFEVGGPTQGKNGYLASKVESDVPNFRGVVGAVLRQVYLGLNPYPKKWDFRISRVHVRQNGLAQWYDAKAEIEHKKVNIPYNQNYWKYLVTAPGDNSDYSSPSFDDSSWPEGLAGFGSSDDGGHYTVGTFVPSGVVGRSIWIRKKIYFQNPASIGDLILDVYHDDGAWLWWNGSPVSITATESYYYAIGNVPGSLVQAENTVVLKVTDGVPAGSATNIFGAVSIRSKVSLPQYDLNPAHIIRECLTDPDWGMGYQDADIDDTSFMAAADTLYDEGMGISILWDRQMPIEDFIKEIIKHIDAVLYIDRTTGKFVLRLIRGGYNAEDLLLLNEDNIIKLDGFQRTAFGELTNSVTVNYWDSETGNTASLTVQDIALAQMQGAVINTTVQYPGFTNSAIASRVAQRDLKSLSTPLITCTIYANQDAKDLNIGDVFRLAWKDYELNPTPMRVNSIAYGDGKKNQIKITAVQDVFALPDTASVSAPPPPLNPSVSPVPVNTRQVFEVPYLELVQVRGQTEIDNILAADPLAGFVGAAAIRPLSGAINARMLVDAGAGYEEIGALEFAPGAKLASAIGRTETTLPIQDGVDLDQVVLGTWLQCDSEIMAVTALSDTSITVKRGCLDTVPAPHAAGAALAFWDNYAQGDERQYASGETVKVKLQTVTGEGELPAAQAPEDAVTMSARAARPYPPGAVRINSQWFPEVIGGTEALSLSWAHRDRKQQTGQNLIGFTDGSIGPEPGTTYNLRLYGETGSLLRAETGLTGTGYIWTAEATDSGLGISDDPYWNNVTALLHFDGADASTTFTDERGHVFTASGNAQIDTAQSKWGGASLLLDGSGDSLSTPHSADFNFGTGDFTVEWWMYLPVAWTSQPSPAGIVGQKQNDASSGWVVYRDDNQPSKVNFRGAGTNNFFTASTPATNTWQHWAVTRQGTTVRWFLNGVLDATGTNNADINDGTAPLYVGFAQTWGGYLNSWIDDLRITKGVARYTASFTPPSSPFPSSGSLRLNGRIRFELESVRDGKISYQKHNVIVDRTGWGYNWGKYWGGPPP